MLRDFCFHLVCTASLLVWCLSCCFYRLWWRVFLAGTPVVMAVIAENPVTAQAAPSQTVSGGDCMLGRKLNDQQSLFCKKKQWVTLFKSNYTGGLWVLLISTLSSK